VTEHIAALQKKHAERETELDDQNSRPIPDTGAIADLKRQILAIKDELAKLSTGQPATLFAPMKSRFGAATDEFNAREFLSNIIKFGEVTHAERRRSYYEPPVRAGI
jgi:hypothetical protein